MKNSYKIVAVDLDGTLLKSDKTIHPDSICDIELATAEGLEVVYNTGRAIAEIEPFFSAVPEMRYAICYSGAIVYDCLSGKIIYHNEIRQKYVRKIVEVANKYHAMVHFLDTNASIVSKTDQRLDQWLYLRVVADAILHLPSQFFHHPAALPHQFI